MTRRQSVRRPRRVQVSFWRRGESTPYVGYTTNISMTGMFIATNSPMGGGSRIRVEVVDRDRGFMVEGVVAHARKISGEMARISLSGMGVRFLTVEELVRELIPSAVGSAEAIPHSPPPQSTVDELEMPAPPVVEPLAEPLATPFLRRRTDGSPSSPEPVPPSAPPRPIGPSVLGEGAFSVHFTSADEFLEVYRRDILQGGLFVSTLHPARIQESVLVELYPPLPDAEPIRLRARVVHRFEPHSADAGGHNLLSGMGLELFDLPALVEQLHPVVSRLRE
ncbi:MAG TPA: PilZ domain-containing protein [Thermoanaerobaculia bacterium]|nr:PilZ domain-containing protein [Thermoanaerobaculia bacterium]